MLKNATKMKHMILKKFNKMGGCSPPFLSVTISTVTICNYFNRITVRKITMRYGKRYYNQFIKRKKIFEKVLTNYEKCDII